MTEDTAHAMALNALAWIAGSQDLLEVFLGSSGASVDDLRTQAQDPVFLGSVLDFLLMDDAWVVEFCDAQTLGYDQPQIARQLLPGGNLPNWT